MNNVAERPLNGDVEDDEEDEANGGDLEAWERTYAEDRSWESLQEDESGLLRPIDNTAIYHAQYRRRLRALASTAATARIQKGLIRYLYVIVDFSKAAAETDFRPSRMAVIGKQVEAFIREFFDQNPLSHVGLVTIKDGIAYCLTDLGGSPESHIKALMGKLECSGDASLQNALELVLGYLNQIPSYGHREVLILYSALSTCDPGDLMETIQKCKKSKIRCSVIGLAAEMFVCKHLCQETGGTYSVALDESHFKELILEHAPPPPAIAEYATSNLIKMGFPQRAAEGSVAICTCHQEAKTGGGYTCPKCKVRVCELPTECRICGLTLISSPHLARSYHHLFPIVPFDEVTPSSRNDPSHSFPNTCFGCQQSLLSQGNKPGLSVSCPKCKQQFCLDCDIYIHESLHNCPGCESFRHSKSVTAAQ
ncbi:general transcription factor IIH subunit 2 [Gastrolobium bilobum]|uniref:general transcription factor IIH subunit 2 n=1 Tax=Gastrolobium bilobum TaxID=150636 RepID=UPI002AB07371|nr:general transcription factor IIH subunit 2 [Gastrolobium bilobum]